MLSHIVQPQFDQCHKIYGFLPKFSTTLISLAIEKKTSSKFKFVLALCKRNPIKSANVLNQRLRLFENNNNTHNHNIREKYIVISVSKHSQTNLLTRNKQKIVYYKNSPARNVVPIHERTLERNKLKGNDPTRAM